MRILSLFTGAGGLDWGFHKLGCLLASANDIKKDAALTYQRNFPVRIHLGPELREGHYTVWDVSETFIDYLLPHPQELILLGGPPCQDFSIMRGKDDERKGVRTRRGKLYLQFARYLAVAQPAAFVFENVVGLLSSNKGMDFRTILEDFENLEELALRWEEQHRLDSEGTPPPPEDLLVASRRFVPSYRIVHKLVDMSAHGVPQKRKRVILVGFREDLPLTNDHLRFVEEFLSGDPLLSRYPLTAIEALEGRVLTELEEEYQEIRREYGFAFGSGHILDDYLEASVPPLFQPLIEEALEKHEEILRLMGWRNRSLTLLPEDSFEDGSHVRAAESPAVVERMRQILPGENHTAVDGTEHEVQGRGFSLVYRRLHPLQPSYTVVAHGGGGDLGIPLQARPQQAHKQRAGKVAGLPG